MPGRDGTGPMGSGPMTGGGQGYCVTALKPAGTWPAGGRGFYRRGAGRGFRNNFYATGLPGWMRPERGTPFLGDLEHPLSPENELSALKNQADYLKNELTAIQARVRDLESK